MLVLDNVNLLEPKRSNYVALGSFDGLHIGHLSLINKVKELAKDNEGKSMVFTFKNHPRTVIMAENNLDLLMTNREKIDILLNENVDILALKTFDKEVMKMDPEEFIKWLCNDYSIRGIVVGFNFRFGYKNLGDIDLLNELKEKYNYELYVMEPYIYEGDVVSSTRIRKEILNGNVAIANKMLSRPYTINGNVVHGKKLGRQIGFPTANINLTADKLIPKVGVYYTNVEVNGKIYKGITSIGNNPTVNGKELTIETYILDFDKYIYDEEIKLYFIDRIRDEMKFSGIDELVCQLKKDKILAEGKETIRQK
ncbi:bifunctional riboflavin kinase/FAD synthetase [Clostridium sp. NSJ-49]|uniref:Riboflavin biosynthesis protein n=1 Tax=Clostridium disporicum TaxID=84024 RepID=A0A173Y2K2_9CLOT|nr:MULTISPECIES: bifunctional riboflavin kinase/FAD synthetase [Clostridium]MBC5625597.1 bifunctional riboflavin kinase/FAD synthetase [Clostridium sp. NSJ-49]MDU6339749.1 bifunctional riboflavin kinase/FAD synthetase [Clostridium sp.]CUN57155.1 bifunctional riboflavin kinase/FMN adenylyltransferase [Clostridium disporicum]